MRAWFHSPVLTSADTQTAIWSHWTSGFALVAILFLYLFAMPDRAGMPTPLHSMPLCRTILAECVPCGLALQSSTLSPGKAARLLASLY